MSDVRIPPHNEAGVIPPFIGDPRAGANCGPYLVHISDVVARFGTTSKRRDIIAGLIRYRRELRAEGFKGFQWLDGGFLDRKAADPKDVDLITFFRRRDGWDGEYLLRLADRRPELVSQTFEAFLCDAYFVDLDDDDREGMVQLTAFWLGLFSHQKLTGVRRGLVRVNLEDDDEEACAMLQTMADLENSQTNESTS